MNSIRQRATEIFPSVMLTVLSMVQALALELLWTRLGESPYLWAPGWDAVIGWCQVLAVLLGLMEIWLFYISMVVRFRWVPSIYDSVIPFGVGLIEFSAIELIGPGTFSGWLCSVAILLLVAVWSGQSLARRARLEVSNQEFFGNVQPAGRREFWPVAIFSGVMIALAAVIQGVGEQPVLALCSTLLVIVVVVNQAEVTRRFWNQSISSPVESQPSEDPEP